MECLPIRDQGAFLMLSKLWLEKEHCELLQLDVKIILTWLQIQATQKDVQNSWMQKSYW